MPNAKDIQGDARQRILLVGRTGSGKTAQIWTLPGRKFAYIFDPNALATLQGCDLDYEVFMPDILDIDMTLKGFNKGARSDNPRSKKEPSVSMRWTDDFNKRYEEGFFKQYDWLIFDSFTFISKAIMARQLFINGRYGDIEDLADFRIVGSKLSEVFGSIAAMDINIYATGHISSFQDDKTKKIETLINLPGSAKNMIPLQFSNIWLAHTGEHEKGVKYEVRTVPEPRGLQDIRTSIPGLSPEEDVTIGGSHHGKRVSLQEVINPTQQGIGRLLSKVVKPKLQLVK